MAVGELLWHSKLHVAVDGTASDVVVELPPGWYLVIAKASFVQEATYASDSSGWLTLWFDDGEGEKVLDYCTARFGSVEYSQQPVLEYPHSLDKPDFIIVGWNITGLAGGVAVINALVSAEQKGADGGGTLRLVTGTQNAQVSEGAISVLEVSVPPQRQAQIVAHMTPP
jgi:hypothetical protein